MAAHLPTGLIDLAARQGRCFTVRQAARFGLDARRLRVLAARGLLVRRHASVYGLGGDDSWEHHLWSGVLQHGGSVPSHESAGRLHRLPAMRDVVELIVPAGSHPRTIAGIRVHQTGPVPVEQLTVVSGFLTTNIERTVCDLAGVLHPARLGFVLDRLLVDQRTTLDRVGAMLSTVSRRGRPGSPGLGRLLDARSGRPVGRSELERMLDGCLSAAGLHEPIREYPLPTDGSLHGFVDRAFPAARLIVEADGRRWHARYTDFARDRARDRLAARRGWLTIRVSHEELRADAESVGRDLREVHRVRSSAAARPSA